MIVGRDEQPREIETEVKIYYPDLDEIKHHLENAGADQVHGRVHEWNMRYDKKTGSFAQQGYVLRLRRDDRTRLTYKGPSSVDKGIMEREELEVETDDYDTMNQILLKLGFVEHMVYEKYRTTYELHQTEIVLDEMPFGNFVEIEGDTEHIEDVLEQLNLRDAKRIEHSYASLFDFVKHHLDLEFRDLTFENFDDIDVPEHAFVPPGSIVIE